MTEWSIQQVARIAGTTSRTLRHYDATGLVPPTRVGSNGYRYYDEDALVRLQRVLLLRELGLGVPAIAGLLAGGQDDVRALEDHLGRLRAERELLGRRIASVERTIDARRRGEGLMPEEMFDGFDHERHRAEVEERWGSGAYAASDAWWRRMNDRERSGWTEAATGLISDWRAAAAAGSDPAGEEGQALARRQFEWLRGIPGTPGADGTGPTREYFTGLAEMYVADARFAATYGGPESAAFVRDAMLAYADREL